MSSVSNSGYADLNETKGNLNQSLLKVATNEKVANNMRAADNYINVQIGLHAKTPVVNPDPELISLASALAATYFNYWQTPIKDRNLDGIKQWEQKVQDHILAYYGKFNPNGLGGGELFGSTKGYAR